jgi:hypothetical protein
MQIFFFGAEITQVYANTFGSHPKARQLVVNFMALLGRTASHEANGKTEPDGTGKVTSPWFN